MSHPPIHAFTSALSVVASMARQHLGLKQEEAAAKLKAGALAHMVDALVTQRVDVVKEGFTAILATYADQARHYMAQQDKYADKELEATDPFMRVQWRGRIQKIDVELATIRADAKLLYEHMTDVLLALGGTTPGFVEELAPSLQLSLVR